MRLSSPRRRLTAIAPDNLDVRSLQGQLHMMKEEWSVAQGHFEDILKSNQRDLLALLSLGKIFYENSCIDVLKKKVSWVDSLPRGGLPAVAAADRGGVSQHDKYKAHAVRFFDRALLVDPDNVYAANALGVLLADRGFLDDAREIFQRVCGRCAVLRVRRWGD